MKKVGVGKTVTYKAGATVKKVTVKNKKVVKATISKKNKKHVTLKGLKAGTTTVTVKTSKKTIKLNVKVGATKITKKTLKTTMTAGDTQTVSVTATGGKGDTIKFASSNKAVLKVNKTSAKANTKGIAKMGVAAVAEGTAKLTVSSKNTGVKKAFTIKVVAATPAPATQAPATGPAVTTAAATNAPSVVTTPGVQATATAGTDATQAPGTDVTLAPGSTDAVSTDAPANTDAVATPDVTADPSFDPETATQGAITINTNVSGASIKVLSGETTVAAVTQDATKTSATTSVIAPGVYTVEVSKKGYDTVKKQVTVNGDISIDVELVESLKTGANAVVTNAMTGYENTVLVNDNAEVTVTVKDKDGNPVANKSVVFSLSNEKKYSSAAITPAANSGFEIKGNTVVTTDAEGKATFVVGTKAQGLKSTDETYVGSVQFRASVVGSSDANDVATGTIGFAAINLGSVSVTTKDEKLATSIGVNAAGRTASKATSRALSGLDTTYIATQQVSPEGKTDNAVSFSVKPQILLPGYEQVSDDVDEFVYTIPEEQAKSGKYGTYSSITKTVTLDIDTSTLQYATLNFASVQLSPYSQMTIKCFSDKECTKFITGSDQIVKGEKEQNNFAYQIPLTKSKVEAITVTIESAGQVQTNKNDGFVMKDITGVYNKAGTSANGGYQTLSTAKIDWQVTNPTYSNEKELSKANAVDVLDITPADGETSATTSSTFTYQVPVFPNTGNAVIKEYDKNNKVVAYYLAPTENKYTSSAGNTTYDNTNEISAIVENEAGESITGLKAYKATEAEATTVLSGTIVKTDDTTGTTLTLNSEKVGSTNVKGVISIDGVGSEQLNAANSSVYTSVQWNPIPTEQETAVEESNAFLALAGQKITVYAQLTDANNNPVSLAGENVTFKYGSSATEIGAGDKNVDGATIVSNTGKTDVNGRTALVLSAAEAENITKLKAAVDNDNYNVVLMVGSTDAVKVEKADLYWVEANLYFKNSVLEGAIEETTENDTRSIDVSDPIVGSEWEFAVKTIGNNLVDGELDGYTVDIDGLRVAMSGNTDNKGTYEFTENGVAKATSKVSQEDKITAKIDADSISNAVAFTAKKTINNVETTKTFTSVGEGTPNLNAKLTLNVDWQKEGTKLSLITPMGTSVAAASTTVYVKVTDATGENVAANETVTFKSGNSDESFTDASNGGNTGIGSITVTTDNNGIAAVTIDRHATAKSSIISATIENVDQIASTTINWVNDTTGDFGVVNAAMKTGSTNEVELTFSNEVLAESVQAGEFILFSVDTNNTKNVYYDITSAKASGKKVTLTVSNALEAGQYYVDFGTKKVDGVTYQLADEFGKTITSNGFDTGYDYDDRGTGNDPYEISFYSTKNASFDLTVSEDNADTKITLENVQSPVTYADTDVIVMVDGKIDITADPSSKVITLSNIKDTTKVAVYYMGNVETVTLSANSNIVAANNDIAADANTVVNDLTKPAGTSTTMTYLSTGANGAAATYHEVSDVDGIIEESPAGTLTVTPADGKTATFTITLTKANGDDVVKAFTVISGSADYECKEVTADYVKAAADAKTLDDEIKTYTVSGNEYDIAAIETENDSAITVTKLSGTILSVDSNKITVTSSGTSTATFRVDVKSGDATVSTVYTIQDATSEFSIS